jgi:PKHD-type hydroxylase
MILCIDAVLDAAVLAEARALLGRIRFEDGARTAGWHARLVKANLQAASGDAAAELLRRQVMQRLESHALFQLAVRPRRAAPLLINRHDTGHGYGAHVDDALMGELRSDVSFTLFLSAPEDYDGGALVIDATAGEQSFKLAAGSLLLYPSTALHRVDAVTRGTRFAAVGWAQSLVRDPARRELLFDLETARRALFEHGSVRSGVEKPRQSAAAMGRTVASTATTPAAKARRRRRTVASQAISCVLCGSWSLCACVSLAS